MGQEIPQMKVSKREETEAGGRYYRMKPGNGCYWEDMKADEEEIDLLA